MPRKTKAVIMADLVQAPEHHCSNGELFPNPNNNESPRHGSEKFVKRVRKTNNKTTQCPTEVDNSIHGGKSPPDPNNEISPNNDLPPTKKARTIIKTRTKKTINSNGLPVAWLLNSDFVKIDSSSAVDSENTKREPVILHLKCHLKDLIDQDTNLLKLFPNESYTYNPELPTDILAFNFVEKQYSFIDGSSVDTVPGDTNPVTGKREQRDLNTTGSGGFRSLTQLNPKPTPMKISVPQIDSTTNTMTETLHPSNQHINQKLRFLKLSLAKNTLVDKSCACFWCTFEYSGPLFVLPKYEMDDSVHAYGSFCSPECAAAFLMRQDLDDSVKFERYQLLNNLYHKLYDTNKPISLAPDPYYTLDKYFGTLTIEEYRALSKLNKRLVVIDRPLTRFLPELHEEIDEYSNTLSLHNSTAEPNKTFQGMGTYRVKRHDETSVKVSHTTVMREQFGCA
jgi:hypothetical protein